MIALCLPINNAGKGSSKRCSLKNCQRALLLLYQLQHGGLPWFGFSFFRAHGVYLGDHLGAYRCCTICNSWVRSESLNKKQGNETELDNWVTSACTHYVLAQLHRFRLTISRRVHTIYITLSHLFTGGTSCIAAGPLEIFLQHYCYSRHHQRSRHTLSNLKGTCDNFVMNACNIPGPVKFWSWASLRHWRHARRLLRESSTASGNPCLTRFRDLVLSWVRK